MKSNMNSLPLPDVPLVSYASQPTPVKKGPARLKLWIALTALIATALSYQLATEAIALHRAFYAWERDAEIFAHTPYVPLPQAASLGQKEAR